MKDQGNSLRTQARFNDPSGTELPNHSRSIEAYKEWAASPSGSSTPANEKVIPPTAAEITSMLKNGSSKGNVYPTLPVLTHQGVRHFPFLVTPRNYAGQRLKYVIYEYETLIDSSEIGQDDFIRIATGTTSPHSFHKGTNFKYGLH